MMDLGWFWWRGQMELAGFYATTDVRRKSSLKPLRNCR